jgi:DNA modification methylase
MRSLSQVWKLGSTSWAAVDAAAGASPFGGALAGDRGGLTSADEGTSRTPPARTRSDYAEFERLLAAWFGNIARVLLPGHAFWLWGGYANIAIYPAALQAAGLYFSQTVIWVKEHPVLTRKDMMAFYGRASEASPTPHTAAAPCGQ